MKRITIACNGGRVVRFLVCLQVFRPSPLMRAVELNRFAGDGVRVYLIAQFGTRVGLFLCAGGVNS